MVTTTTTGDGDYTHMCLSLRKMGAHVVLIAREAELADSLKASVSEFVPWIGISKEPYRPETETELLWLRQISRESSTGSSVLSVGSSSRRVFSSENLSSMRKLRDYPLVLLRQISRQSSTGSSVLSAGSLSRRVNSDILEMGKMLMRSAFGSPPGFSKKPPVHVFIPTEKKKKKKKEKRKHHPLFFGDEEEED
jgi:hypothetical protein